MVNLSSSLQVPEVNVRDEENRLSLQVGHGLEKGGVRLLLNCYYTCASIFSCNKEVTSIRKRLKSCIIVYHFMPQNKFS